MSVEFQVDASDLDVLYERMESFGVGSGQIVDEVIHSSGEEIYGRINPLIHPSGRTFKGHRTSATSAHWASYDTDEALSITVAARGKHHYLYFPDDGSNTERHAGGQGFFLRGAQAAAPDIVERCLNALVSEWK